MSRITRNHAINELIMSFSEGSADHFSRGTRQLAELRKRTKIGIFGSFSGVRKTGLVALKDYLRESGYDAHISEDLDTRPAEERKHRDSAWDRRLSDRLIEESDIHLFVFPRPRKGEPRDLLQSVSMELERVHTICQCARTSGTHVAVFCETGLKGTMGGVCEGLLEERKEGWTIGEFDCIDDTFKPARQFCMNCILGRYHS